METRQLSFVVLDLRGQLDLPGAYLAENWMNGSGAQMTGLEALGDCGHSPSRGLNKNDSRNKKTKVSARTVMAPM